MYRSYTKSVDIDVNNQNYSVNISTPTSKNINLDILKTVGGGDKFFLFRQNVPSNVWEIKHNLNKYPSVTVVDSGDSVVVGEVTYIDNNNLVISFVGSFSGKAYLN